MKNVLCKLAIVTGLMLFLAACAHAAAVENGSAENIAPPLVTKKEIKESPPGNVVTKCIGETCPIKRPPPEKMASRTKETPPPNPRDLIVRIVRIEIRVETCEMRVFGETAGGKILMVVLPAGTAKPGKWTEKILYGVEYKIGHLTFHPPWRPTKDMQDDQKKKGLPPLKEALPGSESNPLGKLIKFYFYLYGINTNYGAHTTNHPGSVGKRVSHGCDRLYDDDATWMGKIILTQNGYNADKWFAWAKAHPYTQKTILLKDRPTVVYMRK